MSMSSMDERSTEFFNPPDSPGSSVSTQLQEEYDELLKYAVIVPSFNPETIPRTLRDIRGSFPQPTVRQVEETHSHGEEDKQDTTVEQEEEHRSHEQHVGFSAHDSEIPDDLSSINGGQTVGDRHTTERPHIPRLATMPMGDPLATQLFMRPDHDDSQSVSGYSQAGDSEYGYSMAIDQDLGRMEHLLDQWTGDLKRNILAEFGQAKIKLIGHHKHQAQKEREKHASEVQRLHTEMDGLRELLHTYESSIERKDQVITNLTRGLQKQREKFDMMKTFSEWRMNHNDMKREAVAGKFAEKYYYHRLQRKCFDGWHSVVESHWRQRVEKACQAKAQEVCLTLTNDYEAKISSLNEALESARTEVNRLHVERESYEETMKKAFMRGVCALNLEAMSMFQDSDNKDPATEEIVSSGQQMAAAMQRDMPPDDYQVTTIPQEAVFHSEPPGGPPPRVVTSQGADRAPIVNSRVITAQGRTSGSTKSGKGKVVSAKISARTEPSKSSVSLGGAAGLNPPMSSVVVERHQPVTKQTVGHATASRYVRNTDTMSSSLGGSTKPVIVQRKIAGQIVPNQNIHTVKLVD